MAQIRPATIEYDLFKEMGQWILSATSYMDEQTLKFKSLLLSADKLANADGYAASKARAALYSMSGNVAMVEKWIRNCEKWASRLVETRNEEILLLSNLGFFSRVANIAEAHSASEEFDCRVPMHYLLANFSHLASTNEGTPVANADEASIVEAARRCNMTLQNLRVTEKQVQAILDVAGEVLRKHKLFFDKDRPVIHTCDDGLLYQLEVKVNVKEASLMTDEVLMAMVERDLDVPGIAFSFIPS